MAKRKAPSSARKTRRPAAAKAAAPARRRATASAAKPTARKAAKAGRKTAASKVKRAKPAAAARTKKPAVGVKRTPAKRTPAKSTRPGTRAKAAARASGKATPKRAPKAAAPSRKVTTARKAAPARARSLPTKAQRTVAPPTRRAVRTKAAAVRTRQAALAELEAERPLVDTPTSFQLDLRHSGADEVSLDEMDRSVDPDSAEALAAGDRDVSVESASAVGDETPGGDNPTPDMDVVDLIGRSLGIEYEDNEELKGAEKVAQRDRKRWELDPASSEDYKDRGRS